MAARGIRDTKHRFPFAEREPCIILQLIFGVHEKPLVVLEEAVAPLQNIVPYITTFAYCAKRRVAECPEKPANGLSIDESAAIVLYTMEWEPHDQSLYYIFNYTLRTDQRENLKPWLLYSKLILTALSRLPSVSLTVCRGVNSEIQGVRDIYQEGNDVVWCGFSSCSPKRSTSEKDEFLGEDGKGTLFIIDCINGKDISEYSYYQKEKEILLLPTTKLQVRRREVSESGTRTIYLTEIQPSHVLLGSVSTPEEIIAFAQVSTASVIQYRPQQILQAQNQSSDQRYINPRLSEYIARCKPNSEVYLIGKHFNEKDIEIVVEELMTKRQCRELFLEESGITSEGTCVIAKALPDNHTLERLFMSHNNISDEGAQMLAKALETNVTLKHLCLGYNRITDEGVSYLSEALKINKTLTHLWLASNKITDRGLHFLANALSVNKTLQVLSLEWNKFSSENSVKILQNILADNKTLTVLTLNSAEPKQL